MKKRIFSLLLALALLCTLLPQVTIPASAETYSGTCGAEGDGSNLTWTLDTETGVLTITGSGAMAGYGWDETPWHEYCETIQAVSLPDGMTSIGTSAFYNCTLLTSVTIPDSVINIGVSAFYNCSGLTSVTIPNETEIIDAFAFCGCTGLENVAISDSVMQIGSFAFAGCTSLKSMIIPDSVDCVPYCSFRDCTALTSVEIGNGATYIGELAFFNCTGLKDLTMGSSVERIEADAFWNCTALENLTLGVNLKSIANNVFCSCKSLTNVTIPDGVTNIATNAFADCSSLTRILIPASVTSIGNTAFENCFVLSIYGYSDTVAQSFAEEYDIPFFLADCFADVTPSDYFFYPVMWAVNHEPQITAGVGDGQFDPHNDCTREQIVTFLWAANGKPEPAGTGEAFSDVASDAWYYKPVTWAVENKITSGMGDGRFGVGQSCTRAQAMTFIWAANNKPEPSSMNSPFSDVTSGDWYYNAVLWAYENGVTAGMGDGSFGAGNTCTRAQIITFLYKVYGQG